MGNMFQYAQWKPQTADTFRNLGTVHFYYTYIHVIKFNIKLAQQEINNNNSETEQQGLAQIAPLLYYKLFSYKIISMQFCNITISQSSSPYDILGKMFKLKL